MMTEVMVVVSVMVMTRLTVLADEVVLPGERLTGRLSPQPQSPRPRHAHAVPQLMQHRSRITLRPVHPQHRLACVTNKSINQSLITLRAKLQRSVL